MKLWLHLFILYFSAGACLPHSDFSQLQNLPDLIEHFHEHKQEALLEGQSIDLLDFLYMHFVSGEDHHDDEGNHEGLPFQNISPASSCLLTVHAAWPEFRSSGHVSFSHIYQDKCLPGISASIFHPPISA